MNRKELITKLHSEGKNDSEIARELDIDRSLVLYYRRKLGLNSNFSYTSKLDEVKDKLIELVNEGYSDYKLQDIFDVDHVTIFQYRKKNNIIRDNLRINKVIKLKQFQKEVLIGTLMGDGSMRFMEKQKSPLIMIEHGIKQKDYVFHKTEIFKSLGATYKEYKRKTIDKRTNIFYESAVCFIPTNPEFVPIYNSFYENKVKKIPFDLLENFTAVSLAYLFMDDGSKLSNGYSIALCNFNINELNKFQKYLFEKFNLETTLHKDKSIYIKSKSKNTFISLIAPYIHKTLLYKLY